MRRPHRHTSARGFTLIELIVVLAIAAGIAIVMLGAARSLGVYPVRSEVMKFAGSLKSAYERSVLTGLRFDIVIDIDANEMRLECSDDPSVVQRNLNESASDRAFRNRRNQDAFAVKPDEDRRAARAREEEEKKRADEVTPASATMKGCDDELVRNHTLKRGITIDAVQTLRTKEPVDSGVVRIAVFPNGTMERSAIWISAGEKKWTFLVHEMTGRVEVLASDERQLRDFFVVEEDR